MARGQRVVVAGLRVDPAGHLEPVLLTVMFPVVLGFVEQRRLLLVDYGEERLRETSWATWKSVVGGSCCHINSEHACCLGHGDEAI